MKLLKFYADWCGPCKGLSMIIAGASDKINVPIEEVDIDKNNDMAIQYNIRSVPTMVLLNDSGDEVGRKTGMMDEKTLLEFLKG